MKALPLAQQPPTQCVPTVPVHTQFPCYLMLKSKCSNNLTVSFTSSTTAPSHPEYGEN